MDKKTRNLILGLIGIGVIVALFFIVQSVPEGQVEAIGAAVPLPLFTAIIGLLDGFNPCTMFVLSMLLGLLVSVSHSKKRIFAVGYTFVAIVFIVYTLFMAVWFNIFQLIGFLKPLRIAIAAIAIVAGLINMKELFFFRKGITLMIQDKHKKPLMDRIQRMKDVAKKGSLGMLIGSSVVLAAFASLVELPCTAGFPIIYTGILTGKVLEHSLAYYGYILLYNVVYILPISVIIYLFGTRLRAEKITKGQMQIIKYVGGVLMLILGITLLANPGLLGV
ncbi:hypothetical protein KY327_03495 [Candidatus Woesearchaeota archaeon]|nr:hypothetical protein [Candidatus Woesearchaeota archaeon]